MAVLDPGSKTFNYKTHVARNYTLVPVGSCTNEYNMNKEMWMMS